MNYDRDTDGDITMMDAIPAPMFQPIYPPNLKSFDKEFLIEWYDKRIKYERIISIKNKFC